MPLPSRFPGGILLVWKGPGRPPRWVDQLLATGLMTQETRNHTPTSSPNSDKSQETDTFNSVMEVGNTTELEVDTSSSELANDRTLQEYRSAQDLIPPNVTQDDSEELGQLPATPIPPPEKTTTQLEVLPRRDRRLRQTVKPPNRLF